MPMMFGDRKVYRIGEALTEAALSRATYFRWIKDGRLKDTQFKDRNGRRVFTEEELKELKDEANRLVESPQFPLKFG